jgi:hypothetical protein
VHRFFACLQVLHVACDVRVDFHDTTHFTQHTFVEPFHFLTTITTTATPSSSMETRSTASSISLRSSASSSFGASSSQMPLVSAATPDQRGDVKTAPTTCSIVKHTDLQIHCSPMEFNLNSKLVNLLYITAHSLKTHRNFKKRQLCLAKGDTSIASFLPLYAHYVLVNKTNEALRYGQHGTDENRCLLEGTEECYSWYRTAWSQSSLKASSAPLLDIWFDGEKGVKHVQ